MGARLRASCFHHRELAARFAALEEAEAAREEVHACGAYQCNHSMGASLRIFEEAHAIARARAGLARERARLAARKASIMATIELAERLGRGPDASSALSDPFDAVVADEVALEPG